MDINYFRKLASTASSNLSGTYIGQIPQVEKDPKFDGYVANASDLE